MPFGLHCIFLLLIEFIFRIFNIGRPHYYQYDNILGSVHRPYAEGYWKKEGYAFIKINSKGLRDYEYDYRKGDNVYRIAVLGDSIVEAFQVPLEKTFCKLLEDKLNSLVSSKKFEVINFGVSGYGTTQEYLMLKTRVLKYSPDLVVVVFFIGNDFVNNVRELEPKGKRPFFVFKDGKLTLDNSFREKYGYRESKPFKFLNYFVVRSHLLTLFFERWGLFKLSLNEYMRQKSPQVSQATSSKFDIFDQKTLKQWPQVIKLTNSIILETKKETDLHNSQFLLVSMPTKPQVTQEISPVNHPNTISDFGLPDKILGSFCRDNQIRFLPLFPHFRNYWQQTKSSLFWGHLNFNGHELTASVIADYLITNQIVPSQTFMTSD